MKYHAGARLQQMDDSDMHDEDGTPITLGYILWKSALYMEKGSNPSGEEKVWAYNLARRLHGVPSTIELSIEELAFLKRNAGLMWSPLVVGQVWKLLEKPIAEDKV